METASSELTQQSLGEEKILMLRRIIVSHPGYGPTR